MILRDSNSEKAVDKVRNLFIMSTTCGNVLFLGVARIADQQGIVVASRSYNTKTEPAVKPILEQPNMQMAPGKHYSFTVGQLAWHLIAGETETEEGAMN